MKAQIRPFSARGDVGVPSSKSELHRLLIAAALADAPSAIQCHALSDDVRATVRCLNALGAEITEADGQLRVIPVGEARGTALPELDCGESGSTLRFLLPVAAALGGAVFTGRGRLPERPIGGLLDAMTAHGAVFTQDRLPLTVRGPLHGGDYVLPGGISSQYITGVLLAAPLLGKTVIRIEGTLQSADYVRMTLSAMAAFGIRTETIVSGITVPGGQRYVSPGQLSACGDWSAAAFPLCLGALSGPVTVSGLDHRSAQGDRRIVEILSACGAAVTRGPDCVTVKRGTLRGITLDVSGIPDMVPALAALLMHAKGRTVFTGAGRLRLKESDRLETVSAMVNALGGQAVVSGDELLIDGRPVCAGGSVQSAGDHRIAMAALVGASACAGPSEIVGAEAVSKSWPAFFEAVNGLGGAEDVIGLW